MSRDFYISENTKEVQTGVEGLNADYSISVRKFKENPKVLDETEGGALAVMDGSEVQFYAVPADLYNDMVNYIEFMQRGNTEPLTDKPSKFNLTDDMVDKVTQKIYEKANQPTDNEDDLGFVECKKNS